MGCAASTFGGVGGGGRSPSPVTPPSTIDVVVGDDETHFSSLVPDGGRSGRVSPQSGVIVGGTVPPSSGVAAVGAPLSPGDGGYGMDAADMALLHVMRPHATAGDEGLNEDDLSDISEDPIEASSRRQSFANNSSNSSQHQLQHHQSGSHLNWSTNLQKERDQCVPSVEDEFFEYDDVKVCTDEMKSKHWRLAGRKPTLGPAGMLFGAAGGATGSPPASSPQGRRDSRQSKGAVVNKFVFADFTVDEIDMAEALQLRRGSSTTVSAIASDALLAAGGPEPPTSPPQPAAPSSLSAAEPTSSVNHQQRGSLAIAPVGLGLAGGGDEASPLLGSPQDPAATRHQRLAGEDDQRRGDDDGLRLKRCDVRTLIGHASRIKCLAIAPGEREFVSCSNEDASLTLCSVDTGREIGIFTGHQDTVINATFSHDGKYLATTSRDHTMVLWDVVTAKQLLTFDHAKVVICCEFSKDSKYVATGCQDKVCRLWETRKGRECLIFAQHEGIIISMSYAPDNAFIVSASADKTLRVWSTTTAKCKFVLAGHVGIVLSVHYANDGKHIVSNDEKLLKVWSTADGSCTLSLCVDDVSRALRHTPVGAKKLTWTLSCAAPGGFTKYLLVACNNRFLYVLDVATGAEVYSVFCKAPVYSLCAGHRHAVGFGDSFGNVYLLNMQ